MKKVRDELQQVESFAKNKMDAAVKETRKAQKEKYEPKLKMTKE